MAIRASASHGPKRTSACRSARQLLHQLCAMTVAAVAVLTQKRLSLFEQTGCRGAMRVMANAAVLRHRLMVMDERPALLCMAHVAGLIDAILFELFGSGRTMRIMAIRTGHFAFQHGMV